MEHRMQPHPYKIAGSDQDPSKFFRLPKVLQITGLGRSTNYRLIAKHQFPEHVRSADRAVAWRQLDLETWIEGSPPALCCVFARGLMRRSRTQDVITFTAPVVPDHRCDAYGLQSRPSKSRTPPRFDARAYRVFADQTDGSGKRSSAR